MAKDEILRDINLDLFPIQTELRLIKHKQDFKLRSCSSRWLEQFKCMGEIAKWNSYDDKVAPTFFEKIFLILFQFVRAFSPSHISGGFDNRDCRDTCIDILVFSSFFVLYSLLKLNTSWIDSKVWCIVICAIVVYLLSTMLGYNLSQTLLDSYFEDYRCFSTNNGEVSSGNNNGGIRSISRSILLFAINYLGVIVGLAILYLATRSILRVSSGEAITTWTSALYFSIVTITTIGCHDIKPLAGLGSALAGLELIIGVILLIIIFQKVITLNKRQK